LSTAGVAPSSARTNDGPAAVYTPSTPASVSTPTYSTKGLSLANNVVSLTAQNNLARSGGALNASLERLASGLKVDRGADGPAALVISEQMRAQIGGLQAALDNTNKAVSLVQTGEGALNEINSLLGKVRGLALDSANAGIDDSDALSANASEIQNALSTIDSVAKSTQFGGKSLLDGSFDQTFQVGANAGQQASLSINAATTNALGLASFTSTGEANGAASALPDPEKLIKAVDSAISQITSMRGSLGAFQANTLESNVNNLRTALEKRTAAESTSRDTDFAQEIANVTRSQVMLQARQSVLGDADKVSHSVLSLLPA
jgi:flagellin